MLFWVDVLLFNVIFLSVRSICLSLYLGSNSCSCGLSGLSMSREVSPLLLYVLCDVDVHIWSIGSPYLGTAVEDTWRWPGGGETERRDFILSSNSKLWRQRRSSSLPNQCIFIDSSIILALSRSSHRFDLDFPSVQQAALLPESPAPPCLIRSWLHKDLFRWVSISPVLIWSFLWQSRSLFGSEWENGVQIMSNAHNN